MHNTISEIVDAKRITNIIATLPLNAYTHTFAFPRLEIFGCAREPFYFCNPPAEM